MNYCIPTAIPYKEKDPVKKLEYCLRVCYKSEDKFTPENAGKLIRNCIKRGHRSFLEHFRIMVACSDDIAYAVSSWQERRSAKFIDIVSQDTLILNNMLVGNLRAFLDCAEDNKMSYLGSVIYHMLIINFGDIFDDTSIVDEERFLEMFNEVEYLGEAGDYITFHVETDRGVLAEWTRHRILSPTVESTRYVKYEVNGVNILYPMPFRWSPCPDSTQLSMWVIDVAEAMLNNGEHKFITPEGNFTHAGVTEIARLARLQATWELACKVSEQAYIQMREDDATPQEARSVLPNSTKVEFYVSGTYEAWVKFIALRNASDAQPQIKMLAERIYDWIKGDLADFTKAEYKEEEE